MNLTFTLLNGQVDELVSFLTSETWAYHGVEKPEGHTRVDNTAMRALLSKDPFVLEAYHRKAWRQSGNLFDTVGYAVIREDWEKNRVTPIPWVLNDR